MSSPKKFISHASVYSLGVVTVLLLPALLTAFASTPATYIHGCKNNLTLTIRVIAAAASCNALTETTLDWQQYPASGTELPAILSGSIGDIGSRFVGKDFSGATFANLELDNTNLSSSTFTGSYFANINFDYVNLNHALINNMDLFSGLISSSDMTYTNGQNTVFSGAFTATNFSNANLSNSDLSAVSFHECDLTGANLTSANITGTNWYGTICPDTTNSDDNSNTCAGHL